MNPLWSPLVVGLEPYTAGEQPQDQTIIKLNTNENPYPPSPRIQPLLQDINLDQLRRYPDPNSHQLIKALAQYHQLDTTQVFVGNGSDEVLAHAFQAFFKQTDPILFPDISYSFYPVYCALYEIDYRRVPLDPDFRIDIVDYAKPNGGVILPNPNAPTGIELEPLALRELLSSNPHSVIVIDEAYVDFGATSVVPLINEFANLLVIRTFSKSRSLAGIRLGYALGQTNLIEALQRVKNSFNSYPVNQLSSAIGIASIADNDYFEDCRQRVIDSRENLAAALVELDFQVFPSRANFIFVRHRSLLAADLYQQLKEVGILVRFFDAPRIDNCLRISIGSEIDCEALITAIAAIIKKITAAS